MTKKSTSTSDALEIPGRFRAVLGHVSGWILARVWWRTTVLGRENVPRRGGLLYAGNHTSLIDGPIIVGASPRPAHFLVKASMFSGIGGWYLHGVGQIPVDPTSGRTTLAIAKAVIARGDVVGVFPEGHRGAGDAASSQPGLAWLALQTGAPVVPVAIVGARRSGERLSKVPWPGRRLLVRFGEPFSVVAGAGQSGRVALAAANETIRERLAAHITETLAVTGLVLPAEV